MAAPWPKTLSPNTHTVSLYSRVEGEE